MPIASHHDHHQRISPTQFPQFIKDLKIVSDLELSLPRKWMDIDGMMGRKEIQGKYPLENLIILDWIKTSRADCQSG